MLTQIAAPKPDNASNDTLISVLAEVKHMPEIAIVLPFYNPGKNWADTFIHHSKMLQDELAGEVRLKYVMVNDGSADPDIEEKLKDLCSIMENVTYITYKENMGKGHALREGVKAADCSYTIITDIDFPYAGTNIANIISLLTQGYDVVTGRRNNSYFNNLPFERKIISKAFVFMNKLFFTLPVYDTQAGIKGFNEKGKSAFLETTINRFLADTEFIMRAHKQKLSFGIIPIHLRHNVVFSNFGSSTIINELKNFFKLIKLNAAKI